MFLTSIVLEWLIGSLELGDSHLEVAAKVALATEALITASLIFMTLMIIIRLMIVRWKHIKLIGTNSKTIIRQKLTTGFRKILRRRSISWYHRNDNRVLCPEYCMEHWTHDHPRYSKRTWRELLQFFYSSNRRKLLFLIP
jgi:hypothetical protein